MAKKRTEESIVLEVVGNYLSQNRYTFWRNNNTPIFDARKNVFRAMPRYSLYGVSDFIVLLNGNAIFIECKSKTGKLSEKQEKFKELVENAGCKFILAVTEKDLIINGL